VFTGLVQARGRIVTRSATSTGGLLEVESVEISPSLSVGDSVSVSGVCLTATAVHRDRFRVDVAHETLRRSTLGGVGAGAAVNLELPLRTEDHLGGHFVQGHVDEVGHVAFSGPSRGDHVIRIEHLPEKSIYVVEKGSISVDGVSLTIAHCGVGWFEVMIIPHTLSVTTLGERVAGEGVNLEYDILAKYVARISEVYHELGHGKEQSAPGFPKDTDDETQ
jgi:riboflavin synthase